MIQCHGTDHIEDLACLSVGQPIGGDQDNGHSTEEWEVGWSDSRQDCSMDHCRGDHRWRWVDTPGICSPSLSGCIPFEGLSLQEDCHTFLWPSVGIWSDVSHELHSGDARGQASSLSTDLPGVWSSVIEGYSEFL